MFDYKVIVILLCGSDQSHSVHASMKMTDKSKSDLIESAAKRNCRTTMIYTLPEGLDFVFRCISGMRSHHTLQLSIQLLFELGNRSLASL